MSLSEELKPCPFCGCDGWIVEDRGDHSCEPPLYRPQCKMCGGGLGGFQYRDNAIMVWNTRAEGVAALQQAGEPVACSRCDELREAYNALWWREVGEPLRDKLVSPLPQQTALVEEGVEKIIGQHEPAACGASAPSEPPRSSGHNWIPSRLGHGESVCCECGITNREAAALGELGFCKRGEN